MSYSIHINGKKASDAKYGLERHIDRENEQDAENVMKDTDSFIDPTQTRFNKQLVKNKHAMKEIRRKFFELQKKRAEEGKRKMRKDAKVWGQGTIQLSNESIEALGWDKNKKAEDQDPEAVKRVTDTYMKLTMSVQAQEDRYGKVVKASLHLDEGSPHVDLTLDFMSLENTDLQARDFLNGRKGCIKGQKLREMQDHLADFAGFTSLEIEKYDLRRGETDEEKKKNLKNARDLYEQAKKERETANHIAKQNQERAQRLREFERELQEREFEANEKARANADYAKKLEDWRVKNEERFAKLQAAFEQKHIELEKRNELLVKQKELISRKLPEMVARIFKANPTWENERISAKIVQDIAQDVKKNGISVDYTSGKSSKSNQRSRDNELQ